MNPKALPSEQTEQLKRDGERHFWPHMRQAGNFAEEGGIKVITRGEGVWLYDAAGRRYLDSLSGLWLVNAGHGRREIADAMHAQMLELAFTPGGTTSPVTVRLAAKIASLAPDPASRVYFVNGGSEANEAAVKLARKYHRNRGEPSRYKVISRRDSYHGATYACMAMGSSAAADPNDYGPLMPGNVHLPAMNPARCAFCKGQGGCGLECARELGRVIAREGAQTVAAFISEPISAAGGIHVPPPDYWPTLRRICDEAGVLLIADEVLTGFGRTGKMFAMENWGVAPDLFTLAKGLTGGYAPIGAVVASKKVADAFIGAESTTFRHIVTTGGNPVSCAAGLANLALLESERLVERSAASGRALLARLERLLRHPFVSEVRGGVGLLCGVEFSPDRATRVPFPKESGFTKALNAALVEHGVLGRAGDVLPLAPPLCISESELDELVSRVDAALADLVPRFR